MGAEMKLAAGILVGCILASSANADYWARNRMRVAPIHDRAGYFEVFQFATAGSSDYWCAAGDFTWRGAGLHNTTRIYLVRKMGPSLSRPGRRSVVFSFVPYDDIPIMTEEEMGYSLSISRPGYNLSAGTGHSYCRKSLRKFRSRGFAF